MKSSERPLRERAEELAESMEHYNWPDSVAIVRELVERLYGDQPERPSDPDWAICGESPSAGFATRKSAKLSASAKPRTEVVKSWVGVVREQQSATDCPTGFLFGGAPYGPRWTVWDHSIVMHPEDGRRVVAAWNATRRLTVEELEAIGEK